MPNTFIKVEQQARAALSILEHSIVVPQLLWRDPAVNAFEGAKNDTIQVRLPAVTVADEYAWRNNRAAEINVRDLNETEVPVTLDRNVYTATSLTDEEETLDTIEGYARQVMQPMVRAVAEQLEVNAIATMDAANLNTTINTVAADDPYVSLIAARKALNVANVPNSQRVVVIGTDIEEWILTNTTLALSKANESGTTSALRQATIGALAGFDRIVVSNALDPKTAYAFHKSAFAFANRAPRTPQNAEGATVGSNGLSLRYVKQFEIRFQRSVGVVSSFMGCTSIEGDQPAFPGVNVRAVKIVLA